MTERDETRRATNRWLFPPTRRRDAYNLQGLRKIQCGWKIGEKSDISPPLQYQVERRGYVHS